MPRFRDVLLPILCLLVLGAARFQWSTVHSYFINEQRTASATSTTPAEGSQNIVNITSQTANNKLDNMTSKVNERNGEEFVLRMGVMPDMGDLRTCIASSSNQTRVPQVRTRETMLSAFPRISMETPGLRALWDFVAEIQKIPHRNHSLNADNSCQNTSTDSMPQYYEFIQPLHATVHTGLGARMRIMTSSFGYAMNNNKTFAVSGPWLWTDAKSCTARNHSCYFLDPGYLSHETPCNTSTTKDIMSNVEQNKDHHYPQSGLWELSQRFQIPPFRINSEFLFFLLQPNAAMQHDIKLAEQLLDWHHLPRPILTVHIRHGKMKHESDYYPTEDYLQAVSTMRERHGFRSVFLITDDRNASQTFAETIPSFGFEALVSLDKPKFEQVGWKDAEATQRDAHLRIKAGNSSPCFEAVTALLNVYIGAQSDGFVGTFNSNLGRMVVKLLYARRGSMPPNVALDKFFTSEYGGTCWQENICLGRTKILIKTASEEYPIATSILE